MVKSSLTKIATALNSSMCKVEKIKNYKKEQVNIPEKKQTKSNDTKLPNPVIDQQRNAIEITGFETQNNQNMDNKVSEEVMQRKVSQQMMQNQERIKLTKHQKKDNNYLKFYKFYFNKLKEEHPKWNTHQITSIISLQWKKKLITLKNSSITQSSHTINKRTRKLSAKEAFKLEHGQMTKQEFKQMWSNLPQQSKNYWKKQGQNYELQKKISEVSSVKKLNIEPITMNPMRNLLAKN